MYGAILGDIIGSPFKFDRGDKTKKFELFTRGCGFTDDSVMTVAVAETLIAVGPDADEKEIEDAVAANMQDWGRQYPNAGYGGKFWHWLRDNKPKPYGSYGNGSAMRVSAAGWLYPTIERTREAARCTAAVTHNHPEGIKGAEATASCIFLARSGASKEDIKNYVEQEFHYDLSRTLDEIRQYYHHVGSCQQTVPEAITAFLDAESFEDAVRNAVSLGGDTDTLASMAIDSHSIPKRNLRMMSNDGKVYILKDDFKNSFKASLSTTYIKSTLTFLGFCKYHDNSLFQEIENKNITQYDNKDVFFLSYHALAKEYSDIRECIQRYSWGLDSWKSEKRKHLDKEWALFQADKMKNLNMNTIQLKKIPGNIY